MEFKDLHPENVPPRPRKSKEEKRKLFLANKIVRPAGPNLTTVERKEVYKYLTGEEYSGTKRGRPSAKSRNFQATIDFLIHMGETSDNVETIKRLLAKKYNLPGADIPDSSEREITPTNFSKIVARQLDELESYLVQYVDAVDNGFIDDDGKCYQNAKICLQGLIKYKKSKKMR